jgi:hypothetical protein
MFTPTSDGRQERKSFCRAFNIAVTAARRSGSPLTSRKMYNGFEMEKMRCHHREAELSSWIRSVGLKN